MSTINANAPQFDLRFNARKPASGSRQEANPFGSDALDLGSSKVTSSDKDFPPGCLTGGSTDITSGNVWNLI